MAKGLDVGTSYIVLSSDDNNQMQYKDFRDAFYVIKPTTPVATKMIEKGVRMAMPGWEIVAERLSSRLEEKLLNIAT